MPAEAVLRARCQPMLLDRVEQAAASRCMKPAEYVRQAVATVLRLDGFDPATLAAAADLSNQETA